VQTQARKRVNPHGGDNGSGGNAPLANTRETKGGKKQGRVTLNTLAKKAPPP